MGFKMGRFRPFSMAAVKKLWFKSSRLGSPKEMLETPSTVFKPNSSRTIRTAFKVSAAWDCWADTVRVRQSMSTFSLGMP